MRQVEAEAEMAVEQQALMENVGAELRREPFCSRREPSVRLSAILQPQRFVTEQTRRAQPTAASASGNDTPSNRASGAPKAWRSLT